MTDRLSIIGKTAQAFNNSKRYIVNSGGTRSGKTYAILTLLHIIASKREGLLISVVSETFPHLRKGAIRDFQDMVQKSGGWMPNDWNKTESTYSYPTGSKIEFFSVDSPSKVHGPQRDILFINEGQNISYDIIRHLLVRTSGTVFIDFNPTHRFWAHELEQDPDAVWIHSTYKDNPYLSAEQVKEIERNRVNEMWWRVYGEGQIGQVEGLVFKHFDLVDQLPETRYTYGMDFGYTNDPTAIVRCCIVDQNLYLQELVYRTGLRNAEISASMKQAGVQPSDSVYCDSSDPKTIDELYLLNWNVLPAVKGPDSVNYGLQLMQGYKLAVTKDSLNLIKELRNYTYEQDKEGKFINKPIDLYNHAIDAARYAVMMIHRAKQDYSAIQQPVKRLAI